MEGGHEKGETGGGDTIRCGSDRTWDGRGEKLRISQHPASVEAGRIGCIPLSVEGMFQDPQKMPGTVLLTEPLYMLTIILHIHTNDSL